MVATRSPRSDRRPPRRRGVAGCVSLVLGVVGLLVGLVAAGGIVLGHVGGTRWTFERLADLRPGFVALGLAALVVLLLGRWWRSAIVLGVVVAVGAWTVAPLWLQAPAPAVAGGAELRIASINLSRNGRIGQLAAYLRDEQPADVVVVVESNRDVDERFRRGDTGYEVAFPRPGERNTQTTVLTRVPVTIHGPVVLDPSRPPKAVDFEVGFGDGPPVRVLGAHPRSPRGSFPAAIRNAELQVVNERVRVLEGPAVVIGDLNVTRFSPAFGLLTEGTDLVDSALGYGYQPTWALRRSRLAFPIDHLLHTPDLTTTSRRIGPGFGSDHRMVLATVARAAAEG